MHTHSEHALVQTALISLGALGLCFSGLGRLVLFLVKCNPHVRPDQPVSRQHLPSRMSVVFAWHGKHTATMAPVIVSFTAGPKYAENDEVEYDVGVIKINDGCIWLGGHRA